APGSRRGDRGRHGSGVEHLQPGRGGFGRGFALRVPALFRDVGVLWATAVHVVGHGQVDPGPIRSARPWVPRRSVIGATARLASPAGTGGGAPWERGDGKLTAESPRYGAPLMMRPGSGRERCVVNHTVSDPQTLVASIGR